MKEKEQKCHSVHKKKNKKHEAPNEEQAEAGIKLRVEAGGLRVLAAAFPRAAKLQTAAFLFQS